MAFRDAAAHSGAVDNRTGQHHTEKLTRTPDCDAISGLVWVIVPHYNGR